MTAAEPWVDVAASLCPLVEQEALSTERAGTVTAPVVDACQRSGLFRMMVPEAHGGAEAGFLPTFGVIELLTAADASTGWSLMANITAGGLASAFLSDEVLKEIFAADDAVLAGMLAPRGTAVTVDGGFRWSGRYGFASGSAHATWLGAGAFVRTDGKTESQADGQPHLRICFVPRRKVELLGNWQVLGLIGTGSFDYELPEQFVDERFTFPGINPPPTRSGPAYQLGLEQLGAAGHGAVAIGLARRALAEIAQLALTKRRPGRPGTADQPQFLQDFAERDAAWRGARRNLHAAYGDGEATARAGDPVTSVQRARMRQAITYATAVADDVVRFAYRWSGSDGLRNDHPLGRCLRDMAAATQHVFVDASTLVEPGRALVEYWADQTWRSASVQ